MKRRRPCSHLFLSDRGSLGGLKDVRVSDEVCSMSSEILLHQRQHHLNSIHNDVVVLASILLYNLL